MLHNSPGTHYQHKEYLLKKEKEAIYSSVFIKLLGESFISVFTAIYLLSRHFQISQVAIYYILYFAVMWVCMPITRLTMKYFGIKKSMAVGIAILVVYYYLLRQISQGMSYELVGVVYGLGASFYYTSFNVELTSVMHLAKREGSTVALVNIISVIAGIIGPFAGALFIAKISFSFLFTLVSVILFCSLLPLLLTGDKKANVPDFSLRRVLKLGSTRRATAYILNGATEAGYDILWPAFIYLNYKNYIAVGGIVSLTSLVMSIFIYVAGKNADANQIKAYKVGILSNSPTWFVRLMLLTPGGLLLANFLGSATSYLVLVPFSKHLYHSAKESGTSVDYFIYKELFACTGRIGTLSAVILTHDFTYIFIAVAFVTLAQLVLLPELKHKPLHKPQIIYPTELA